jgi:hypothetical protein
MAFPVFPLTSTNLIIGLPYKKWPEWNTVTNTAVNFREVRIPQVAYPKWHFSLDLAWATGRVDDPTSTIATVLGFHNAMQGSAGTFAWKDTLDNAVTAFTCAKGDGATKTFQLTRPLGPVVNGNQPADIVQLLNGTPTFSVGGVVAKNIVPDSDGTALTWTVNATLPFSPTGGAIAGGKWTYTGTGAASGFQIVRSTVFNVIPGATYALSGNIDGTHVTGATGTPTWLVYDPTITTQYGSISQANGVNSRVTGSFTVPGGVTQVVCLPDTGNCTVTAATTLVFSDPQLELGSVATTYQSSFNPGISSLGVLTFVVAPALNAAITWTGSFYFACRFSTDQLSGLEQFAPGAWHEPSFDFESILL